MKEIKAIIQPQRVTRIRNAFRSLPGFPGMSVAKVEGCSSHATVETHGTLREELTEFSAKVMLHIVSPDEMVQPIVDLIHQHGHSGQPGDGLIWVTEVVDMHRISQQPG